MATTNWCEYDTVEARALAWRVNRLFKTSFKVAARATSNHGILGPMLFRLQARDTGEEFGNHDGLGWDDLETWVLGLEFGVQIAEELSMAEYNAGALRRIERDASERMS